MNYRWNNDPQCSGPFPKEFLSYERTLREIRKKRHGKSPQTFDEIAEEFSKSEVMDDIGKSLYGAKGVLYNGIIIEKDFCNCFFSSEHSIALVKKMYLNKSGSSLWMALFDRHHELDSSKI